MVTSWLIRLSLSQRSICMLSSFIDPKLWLTASIGDRVLLDTERGYHVLFPQRVIFSRARSGIPSTVSTWCR